MSQEPQLILVDAQDRVVGHAGKLATHQGAAALHRAFSVVIFNSRDEMLLQLRSIKKYHFGGLWSNACCGHPVRGEAIVAAAEQRLYEEFGFRVPLSERFSFIYRAHDPTSGLTEHEFDRVFCGHFDGTPHPNPEEIDQFRWARVSQLQAEIQAHPERFTPWFRILFGDPRARTNS